MAKLEDKLAELATMSVGQLREEWQLQVGSPAPRLQAALLMRGLAYRLQERKAGSASSLTMRQLRRAAEGSPAAPRLDLGPGAQLVRTWRGRTILVMVEAEGFLFDGRTYGSLSHIAREVTGASWSGPRFFGLTAKEKA